MQVPTAGLNRKILLRSHRIGHRRTLERRADVEAPQLFQRLVMISTPDQFGAMVKSEIGLYRNVVRAANMRIE